MARLDALDLRTGALNVSRSSPTASQLLAEAREVYDRSPRLRVLAPMAWRGGFRSGGEWMRAALGVLRNGSVADRRARFQSLGVLKYSLAIVAVLTVAGSAWLTGWLWLMLASPLAFYAVEAQFVFLFPIAIDGRPRPIRCSAEMTGRAGGTVNVMVRVMRIACTMLFGGLLGGGFVRSWCVGCLAVCVWYEHVRRSPAPVRPARAQVLGSGRLHVRLERVEAYALVRPVRVLYASDLHLGRCWTRKVAPELMAAVRATRPDLILLGGDLVDCSQGVDVLSRLLPLLVRSAPVLAIEGNHDHRAGIERVRATVCEHGARWLSDAQFAIGGLRFVADPADAHGEPCVLVTHEPSGTTARGVRLVLAGHLHGGQCVLWSRRAKLYPGVWFARWTCLRVRESDTDYIVSRGAGDTLPLRWNCPREVILCEIC